MGGMPTRFRLLATRTLHRGRVFTLARERWRGPGGREFTRETIRHPGAVLIVPFLDAATVLAIRQFRAAARRWLLEFPAGTLERGETPLACARREVVEEVGHRARSWRRLGGVYTAPGFCTEYIHLYAASRLVPQAGVLDADEHIEVVPLALQRLQRLARSGEVEDAKTLAALALLLNRRARS
jgi:ADP-ribose pyrophosphatase